MAENTVQIEKISSELPNVKAIISDIEGTTTSIPFVRNTLKTYFLDHLNKYLSDHWKDTELQDILLKVKYECDSVDPISTVEEAEKYIRERADFNDPTYSQKLLQTKVWEEGYLTHGLKGHFFSDVIPAFKKWTQHGKHIYVYSSATELAQKLLFTNSVEGDVYELISGCFDTTIGSKVHFQSYQKILKKLNFQPGEVLFLTDNVLEAEAACKAGMLTVVVHREGNDCIDEKSREKFPIISSFEEITPSLMEKKKKLADE